MISGIATAVSENEVVLDLVPSAQEHGSVGAIPIHLLNCTQKDGLSHASDSEKAEHNCPDRHDDHDFDVAFNHVNIL